MGFQQSDYALLLETSRSKHTPEVAYYTVLENMNVRLMAIREAEAAAQVRAATIALKEREIAECDDPLRRALLEAELRRLTVHASVEARDYACALHEVDVSRAELDRLAPLCCWADGSMTPDEGYQRAMARERALVLLERAHDAILLGGVPDHATLAEMRRHPDADALWEVTTRLVRARNDGGLQGLSLHAAVADFDVARSHLIGAPHDTTTPVLP